MSQTSTIDRWRPAPHLIGAPSPLVHPADRFCQSVRAQLIGALSVAFGNRDVAEELAQDALRLVVERWDKVATLEDPVGYTVRIGFNLGRSTWRRQAAERRALERAGSNPDECEELTAQALAVRQAVRRLPPRQREVILHRYFLDRNVRETAGLMRCAEGTIKALTAHAVASLRIAGLGSADD